jgi:hypothetical protein
MKIESLRLSVGERLELELPFEIVEHGPRQFLRASAPEVLVTEVVDYLKAHGGEVLEEVTVVEEDVEFLLPKELISAAEISRA